MRFNKRKMVRIEKGNQNIGSFVWPDKVFSDITAGTLKSKTTLTYPVDGLVVNNSTKRKEWLTSNRYTLVNFLPVRCSGHQLEREGHEDFEEIYVYGLTCLRMVLSENSVRVVADMAGCKR